MKNLRQSFFASCFILVFSFFTTSAQAGLLIEPHVAYGFLGNADYNQLKITYSGAQYGGKLGYQFFGLMAGLDYTHSTIGYKTDFLGTTYNLDYDRDQVGAFIGYKFPILLRAWAGYYFSDKITASSTSIIAGNGDYSTGSGTELGLGFTGFPFVSVNLLYRTSSYDSSFNASTGVKSSLSPKIDTSEIALGVSLPINL